MLSGLVWLDFFWLGTPCVTPLILLYVGHNIKRQAGFPLQQACVLKTGDKRGSKGLTLRDGKGGGYQKIMRCVDGGVVGQGMREWEDKISQKKR